MMTSGHVGRRVQLAALALVTLASTACSGVEGPPPLRGGAPELHISAAQSSAPVAGTSQLMLTIENRGDGDDRLVGAETDVAIAIEIHRTVIEPDGRAYMRMLEDVLLPAGESVRFRPGGLHLMLVVPDERVAVGGTFTVTLRFERSAPATRTVTVVDLLDLVEEVADGGTTGD
jgi:periplasmic copper chaperone A